MRVKAFHDEIGSYSNSHHKQLRGTKEKPSPCPTLASHHNKSEIFLRNSHYSGEHTRTQTSERFSMHSTTTNLHPHFCYPQGISPDKTIHNAHFSRGSNMEYIRSVPIVKSLSVSTFPFFTLLILFYFIFFVLVLLSFSSSSLIYYYY